MKRQVCLVLIAGAVLGYLAGYVSGPAATVSAQSQGAPGLPELMPGQPTAAMYWSKEDLDKIAAARLAARRPQGGAFARQAAGGQPPAPSKDQSGPQFQSQRFRTHNIGLNARFYWDPPIPANLTGVMSHYDDVELHEGVSDFYVIMAGGGKMVVDGEIVNREYRRAAGPNSLLLPGEFVGQPIRGGVTYDVKPGDWLAIPPNDPHWQLPEPNIGMAYLLLKINVGLYPGSISR